MRTWTNVVALTTFAASLTVSPPAWAAIASGAHTQSATATQADDNMTPYRKMATDALTAFKAHDLAGAKKKAKALETAWDDDQKALKKQAPDVWDQIDKAMDDFIKPLQGKAPDAEKIQAAYDVFIDKLRLAVRGA